MQAEKPNSLSQQEILRYLSYKNTNCQPTGELLQMVTDAEKTILNVITPKYTQTEILKIQTTQQGIFVPKANLYLQGEDIAAHLENCHSVIIFALTLGQGVDTLLLSKQITDMASCVVLDACANTAIEAVADAVQKEILHNYSNTGLYFTSRFSPGYGDLSIELQPQILRILNAQKAIGLCVTKTNLLTPQKSITAIIGVSDTKVTGKMAGCKTCALKEKCEYKKRGITCGF